MRPYRGLPLDGKEFVYGWLYKYKGKAFILQEHDATLPNYDLISYAIHHKDISVGFVKVVPETVGQQVSLKDKNGKGTNEVYEDDIVICSFNKAFNKAPNLRYKGVIKYEAPEFYLACFWEEIDGKQYSYPVGENNRSLMLGWSIDEILGNIHQNPKLLEHALNVVVISKLSKIMTKKCASTQRNSNE